MRKCAEGMRRFGDSHCAMCTLKKGSPTWAREFAQGIFMFGDLIVLRVYLGELSVTSITHV